MLQLIANFAPRLSWKRSQILLAATHPNDLFHRILICTVYLYKYLHIRQRLNPEIANKSGLADRISRDNAVPDKVALDLVPPHGIIRSMLLTITTTATPATDLGYLLHKNPSRVHRVDLLLGRATVSYPEATPMCLLLEFDPIGLVRRKSGPAGDAGMLTQYVNDS